ncbi:MAG: copper chaperone PCu(A)C [Nocardioides sp.]|nr:copper chaperone PCu(A)C [Nocardioides sp.]
MTTSITTRPATRRLGIRRTKTMATALVAVVAAVTLTACGGSDAAPATQASTVTIENPWVKEADSGMTAAFGTLRNASDHQAVIVSATSSSTSSMELHEMATNDEGEMVMRPMKGGFVIPAGGTHKLDPGSDHLMFMDVTTPIKAGDTVTVTLTFADKSTMKFTAPARTFSGAKENYEGHDDMDGHDHMDMDDMGHE